MKKDLSDYRKAYTRGNLSKQTVPDNPMQLFQEWFYQVDEQFPEDEANAFTLSTIGLDGFPKSRVVLLKKYYEEGFIFYTNYKSEKGKALSANPKVCMSFFWPKMERQVIIKGVAEKTSELESDNYFDSRPLGSRIGAIVSPQSEVIESRAELEEQTKRLEAQDQSEIKRPKHWGGYLIKPESIEFWQGRDNRLHDRIRYVLQSDYNWNIERLAP
jgi:pyridoxamine 5'-phosphate oxidase